MLTPAQVIPFLEHPDILVRRHAVNYLIGAHDPAPATADDLWRAADRFGTGDDIPEMLFALPALPATDSSTLRLLEALRTPERWQEAAKVDLRNALEDLDFPMLVKYREQALSAPVPAKLLEHLKARLDLADEPPERLWDRLFVATRRLADPDPGFDDRVPRRLMEAIARHPDLFIGRVLQVLGDGSIHDWRENWAAELAGRMKLRPAIDLLIGKCAGGDPDAIHDEACDALVGIGDVEAVHKMDKLYDSESWDFRLSAQEPAHRIKHLDCLAVLLRWLETEQDTEVRTLVASGVCELCPTDASALEAVRRVIIQDRYSPGMMDLTSELLAAGAMVGYEPPEAPQWRAKIEADAAEAQRWKVGWDATGPDLGGTIDDPALSRPRSMAGAAVEAPPRYTPQPWRRAGPKVGRNDPCPCGSGKKYKKCCGKG